MKPQTRSSVPLGRTAQRWLALIALAGIALLGGLFWLFRHSRAPETQEVAATSAEREPTLAPQPATPAPPPPGARPAPAPAPAPMMAPPQPTPPPAATAPPPTPPVGTLEAKIQEPENAEVIRRVLSEDPVNPGLVERMRHIRETVLRALPNRPAQ